VAVIGLVAVGVLAPQLWLPCAVLASGCAAVLVLNLPPARIFLGDAGSHLLGYSAAILSLAAARESPAPLRLVVSLLLVSVPLFELVFITAIRIAKGLPWWRGSPDHFSLRLQAMGYSRWLAAGVGWLLALLGAVAAVGLPRVEPALQALIVTLEVVVLAAFARWLVSHERTGA
jgi:UDP-GlcNAc:undecaprenyl-phosphate GlcNAc-1-phosphate transferase